MISQYVVISYFSARIYCFMLNLEKNPVVRTNNVIYSCTSIVNKSSFGYNFRSYSGLTLCGEVFLIKPKSTYWTKHQEYLISVADIFLQIWFTYDCSNNSFKVFTYVYDFIFINTDILLISIFISDYLFLFSPQANAKEINDVLEIFTDHENLYNLCKYLASQKVACVSSISK